MLSSDEIALMRTTLTESLPDSGTIQRLTLTADGMGGGTPAWAAVGTSVCRVAPLNQRLLVSVLVGSRLTEPTYWSIMFGNGVDVTEQDRVATGGRTYEVIGVAAPHSWEICRKCICVGT